MQEAHEKRKPRATFDIYEYIFKLEEEVKALKAERDMMETHAAQLEEELENMHSEINGSGMPRFAGIAKELHNPRDAY